MNGTVISAALVVSSLQPSSGGSAPAPRSIGPDGAPSIKRKLTVNVERAGPMVIDWCVAVGKVAIGLAGPVCIITALHTRSTEWLMPAALVLALWSVL
jgi:hypothetical protein